MKTPDEIKKGLECCFASCEDCGDCPYNGEDCHSKERNRDAFAYIQQIEADNAQQARCIENLTDKLNATNDALAAKAELVEQYRLERDVAIAQLEQLGIGLGEKEDGKFEQVKRERDAAIADLSKSMNCCYFCKHDAVYTSVCDECKRGSNFAWRGLCYENGGAEDGQDHPD